jgi:hypothetical protein
MIVCMLCIVFSSLSFGPQQVVGSLIWEEFFYLHLVKLFSVSASLFDGFENNSNIYSAGSVATRGARRLKGPVSGADTGAGNNSRPNLIPIALFYHYPIDQAQT